MVSDDADEGDIVLTRKGVRARGKVCIIALHLAARHCCKYNI